MGHYAYFCDRICKTVCLFLIAGFSNYVSRVSFLFVPLVSFSPFLFSSPPLLLHSSLSFLFSSSSFLFLPFFSLPPFLFSSSLSFFFLPFFSLSPLVFSSSFSFLFLPFFSLLLLFFYLPPFLFSSSLFFPLCLLAHFICSQYHFLTCCSLLVFALNKFVSFSPCIIIIIIVEVPNSKLVGRSHGIF
jgi:hypothetical protein